MNDDKIKDFGAAYIKVAQPLITKLSKKLWTITKELEMPPMVAIHAIGISYEQQMAAHLWLLANSLAQGDNTKRKELLEEEIRSCFSVIRQIITMIEERGNDPTPN